MPEHALAAEFARAEASVVDGAHSCGLHDLGLCACADASVAEVACGACLPVPCARGGHCQKNVNASVSGPARSQQVRDQPTGSSELPGFCCRTSPRSYHDRWPSAGRRQIRKRQQLRLLEVFSGSQNMRGSVNLEASFLRESAAAFKDACCRATGLSLRAPDARLKQEV